MDSIYFSYLLKSVSDSFCDSCFEAAFPLRSLFTMAATWAKNYGWGCDLASDNVRQWNVQKLLFTDSWRSNCISVMSFHVHFPNISNFRNLGRVARLRRGLFAKMVGRLEVIWELESWFCCGQGQCVSMFQKKHLEILILSILLNMCVTRFFRDM